MKNKPPLLLIALDAIGVVLIGVALAEKFANVKIVPVQFLFKDYQLLMIMVGIFFALPYLVWIVRDFLGKKKISKIIDK